MNNTSLTRRSIFDIQEWDEFSDLTEYVNQIRAVSMLETKINQFKDNFLISRLYSFNQLLENEDICWVMFRAISKWDCIGLFKLLEDTVAVSSILEIIPDKDIINKILKDNKNKVTKISIEDVSWDYEQKKSLYKDHSGILAKLFSTRYYLQKRGFHLNDKYSDELGFSDFNRIKNYKDLEDDVLNNINKRVLLIYPKNKEQAIKVKKVGRGPWINSYNSKYNGYYKQNVDSFDLEAQENIIDVLGGYKFIEQVQEIVRPGINSLRSYYKKRKDTIYGYNYRDFLYALNKYKQPIPVLRITRIRDTDIYIDNNYKLNIIVPQILNNYGDFSYTPFVYSMRSTNFCNSRKLVFNISTSRLEKIYRKTSKSWKLVYDLNK